VLFPVADLGVGVAGLHVTASLPEAISYLEVLLIERTRTVVDAADNDADDGTAGRAALAPVLLLTDAADADQRAQVHTVLRAGAALGITAAALGDWPDGDAWTVRRDGLVATTGQRLPVLDASEAWQLLGGIAAAATVPPPTGPAPAAATGEAAVHDDVEQDSVPAQQPEPDRRPAAVAPVSGPPRQAGIAVDAGRSAPSPTLDTAGVNVAPHPAPEDTDGSRRQRPATPSGGAVLAAALPVRVRLLGVPAVYHPDGSVGTGLRFHARELLVYLAVHRGGADLADIMEAIWPHATMKRAGERLSTEVSNLRRHIRDAAAGIGSGPGGGPPAGRAAVEPVVNTGGRYHLNPAVVDVDLWRLDDALRAAAAGGSDERRQHLLAAVHAHAGPLADGFDYDWVEPHRERVRRQGIRARAGLAELLGPADPTAAADLLQAAADLDPRHEELARRCVRALARAGDNAGAGRRLTQLREALAALGETPSAETLALAAELSIGTTASAAAAS
jgi:DNA-binding SARP family transcriptional activator